MQDTVEHAATTRASHNRHGELGLKDDEYRRIRQILGRRPTDTELAMYSVMWSGALFVQVLQRCACALLGETTSDEMRAAMLAGIS